MTTMKEMCETIEKAKILTKPDGSNLTAKEIFNYHPRGELFMIWEWYEKAKIKERRKQCSRKKIE